MSLANRYPRGSSSEAPGLAAALGRRTVMKAAACLAISMGVPGARLFPAEGGQPVPFRELFADAAPVRFLGALYLRQRPDEADGGRLCRALFGGSPPRTVAAIARSIAARRARDLEVANIVVVDGWLLARCEAQFCALVALAGPSR